jgi:regulator of cell morphogenesis and NO signaling
MNRAVPSADLVSVSLGDLVTRRPAAARVFDTYGLDYCCGGFRTLAEACATAGVDPAVVEGALAALQDEPTPAEWATLGPGALADHVQRVHHEHLAEELPRLRALLVKVYAAHRDNHPELDDVVEVFDALHDDLVPHLAKEDAILFPMIRDLDAAFAARRGLPPLHCGSLANPIRVMLAEHEDAGVQLARLHAVTGGYAVPDDACASYRALYDGLLALDRDLRLHVHKESNVLFPEVLRMEAELARTGAPA